jgi:hypothetical protein
VRPVEEDEPTCCTLDGQFKLHKEVCRWVQEVSCVWPVCVSSRVFPVTARTARSHTHREAAGVCDTAELCSGHSGECPADELRPKGALCAPVTSPCVLPSTCDGDNATCGDPEQRQPGDKCPW